MVPEKGRKGMQTQWTRGCLESVGILLPRGSVLTGSGFCRLSEGIIKIDEKYKLLDENQDTRIRLDLEFVSVDNFRNDFR